MASVGMSRMKTYSVVIVEPGAKVNSEYYCEHFLSRGFLLVIQATWSHQLRQDEALFHTARNMVNFLLQENATFIELDKWHRIVLI